MATNNNTKYNNIYKLLIDKLSFITINEQTVDLLKNNSEFNKIFIKSLSTLIALEKKLKLKNEKSKDLISAYQTIVNKQFKAQDIKITDIDTLEDNVNYIDVYLRNTIGLEISNNEHLKNENIEDVEPKVVDGQEVHNFSSSTHQSKVFNAEEFLKENNVTADALAEQMVRRQAEFLLRKDIIDDKVYKFDSKPKIVVLLKMIALGLFFLFFCFTLVYLILFSVATDGYFVKIDKDEIINILGGGVNYFLIISIVLATLFAGFKIYSEIRYFKNNNFRYTVKLTHIIFSLFIFILFLLSFIDLLKGYSYANEYLGKYLYWQDKNPIITDVQPTGVEYWRYNSDEVYKLLLPTYAVVWAIIGAFIAMICVSVVLFIIKPRVDLQRLNDIILKYINDIKTGKISVKPEDLGPTNPFSSMFF